MTLLHSKRIFLRMSHSGTVPMRQKQDRAYHRLDSKPALVADLLRHFVPVSWGAQLNFGHMERINSIFHPQALERRNGENPCQTVADLITWPSCTPLWSYQPEMRYHLTDESRYPEGRPGSLCVL